MRTTSRGKGKVAWRNRFLPPLLSLPLLPVPFRYLILSKYSCIKQSYLVSTPPSKSMNGNVATVRYALPCEAVLTRVAWDFRRHEMLVVNRRRDIVPALVSIIVVSMPLDMICPANGGWQERSECSKLHVCSSKGWNGLCFPYPSPLRCRSFEQSHAHSGMHAHDMSLRLCS